MANRANKKGWAVWITGLPGSGKSTVANALYRHLSKLGIRVQLIPSDELRREITPSPTYSEDDRNLLYACIAYVAKKLTENEINVIIDATGNRRKYRDLCRKKVSHFIEVYLKCPLETCAQREMKRKYSHRAPRRIYEKGIKGESSTVPGIGVQYEEPENPEISLNSAELSARECEEKIFEFIAKKLLKK